MYTIRKRIMKYCKLLFIDFFQNEAKSPIGDQVILKASICNTPLPGHISVRSVILLK